MNKIIYLFWFGDTMSDNRRRCYNSILENSGVEINLVNDDNISQYYNDLHPGFQYLSVTHKSDYLRSYFMYNYGGGYTDIKYCDFNWNPYFESLLSTDYDFLGYHEIKSQDVCVDSLKNKFKDISGPVQFIFKPKTEFAKEWLDKTNKKMDQIFDQLQKHPGHYHPRAEKGGAQGENKLYQKSEYPLAWNELLGQIFQPLSYEYRERINNIMPYPNIENYR